jgi:hypothetical protein
LPVKSVLPLSDPIEDALDPPEPFANLPLHLLLGNNLVDSHSGVEYNYAKVREYLVTVFKLWGYHISGPVLAVVSIGLSIAAVHYANDPGSAAWFLRRAAQLTVSATVLLIFVAQYDAWSKERDSVEKLRVEFDTTLPKFEVAIEQMTTGSMQGSLDGKTFAPWTFAAPLIRILNLGAQSVVQDQFFKIIRPDGSVIQGKGATPPTEIAMTDASGNTMLVPFGESSQDFNIKPIQRGAISRGRSFLLYEGLTQAEIGGPGFKYEVTIRDAWYPKTPEYVASIEWKTADPKLFTFPGMGVKAKMVPPIKLD